MQNAENLIQPFGEKTRKSTTVKSWDAEKKKPKGASGQPTGKPGNGKEPRDFHLVGTKARKL